jgi:hypothetical protein
MCSNYSLSICPRFLEPFTALPEGRTPKALCSRISSSGTSRGPTIDIFNFGSDRCRTLPPAPPGGLHSTSSTSVVATVGPCRQHPQGSRHRHLQLWWWPLPDLAASTPRGPAIDVFNFGGGRCRTLLPAPPGGPPSTSSTLEVAAIGSAASTP